MSAIDEPTAELTENPIPDLNTGFLRDMLVTIGTFNEKPSGQEIKERMEEIAGYDNLNHGRLYPALDELVEKGLVQKGQIDRRTNSYTLTERGVWAREEYAEFVSGSEDETRTNARVISEPYGARNGGITDDD